MLPHAIDADNDSDNNEHDSNNIIDEIDFMKNEIGLKHDEHACLIQRRFSCFSTDQ